MFYKFSTNNVDSFNGVYFVLFVVGVKFGYEWSSAIVCSHIFWPMSRLCLIFSSNTPPVYYVLIHTLNVGPVLTVVKETITLATGQGALRQRILWRGKTATAVSWQRKPRWRPRSCCLLLSQQPELLHSGGGGRGVVLQHAQTPILTLPQRALLFLGSVGGGLRWEHSPSANQHETSWPTSDTHSFQTLVAGRQREVYLWRRWPTEDLPSTQENWTANVIQHMLPNIH